MVLAKRLKELRSLKNLSQSDLANILSVDRSTYGKYETGDSSPDYEKLIKLADFFGVTVDYLIRKERNVMEKTIQIGNAEEFQKLIEKAIILSNQLKETLQQIEDFKIDIQVK